MGHLALIAATLVRGGVAFSIYPCGKDIVSFLHSETANPYLIGTLKSGRTPLTLLALLALALPLEFTLAKFVAEATQRPSSDDALFEFVVLLAPPLKEGDFFLNALYKPSILIYING